MPGFCQTCLTDLVTKVCACDRLGLDKQIRQTLHICLQTAFQAMGVSGPISNGAVVLYGLVLGKTTTDCNTWSLIEVVDQVLHIIDVPVRLFSYGWPLCCAAVPADGQGCHQPELLLLLVEKLQTLELTMKPRTRGIAGGSRRS